ncbi:MAG: type IV pilus biogenesis/stability protein PilW, partial [Legionellaceae bacterium]|nr:type IV pilus biogenesis/stability protein PilW [Legionellaceae bacterium]
GKALQLAPESGAHLNNYGTFLCRTGKYQEADAFFVKATQDVHYVNTALAYENAGLCAENFGDKIKSAAYFEKALIQDSQRKQSLYELVHMYLQQDQLEQALQWLQKYPDTSFADPACLALAVEVSQRLGKEDLLTLYKSRLKNIII